MRTSPRGKAPVVVSAIVAVGLLVAVAVALWLHSEGALRALGVPLLERALGAELAMGSGRLHWGGRLEAEAVVLRRPGLEARFRSVSVRLAWLSFLLEPRPRLRELALRGAEVVVEPPIGEGGAASPAPAARPVGESARRATEPLVMGVTVEHGRADGRVEVRGPTGAVRARWSDVDLEVTGWVPGGRPELRLRAEVALQPDDPARAWRGSLSADGGAEAGPSGDLGSLHADATLEMHPPGGGSGPPLGFQLALERTVDAASQSSAALALRGMRGEQTLGRARAELRLSPGGPGAPAAGLALHVEIEELAPDFVNPWLAAAAGLRVTGGRAGATLDADGTLVEGLTHVRLRGSARELRLATPAGEMPRMALDVQAEGARRHDGPVDALELTRAEAHVELEGRRVVELRLLAPLALAWQAANDAPEEPPTPPAAALVPSIELRVTELELAPFRGLLAALGTPLPASLAEARVDGTARAGVAAGRDRLGVKGTLSLAGLRASGAPGRPPLSLAADFDGSVDPRGGVRLDAVAARLGLAGRATPLATLAAHGSARIARGRLGALHAEADLAAADLGAARRALTPSVAPSVTLRGGRAQGQVSVSRESAGASWRLALDTRATGLHLRGRSALPADFSLAGSVEADARGLVLERVRLRAGAEDDPRAATLTASGRGPPLWRERGSAPVARVPEPWALHVTVEAGNAEPWLALAGFESWARPSLALRGEAEVEIGGAQDALRIDSELDGRREQGPPDRIVLRARLGAPGQAGSARARRLDLDATLESLLLPGARLRVAGSDLHARVDLERAAVGAPLRAIGHVSTGRLALVEAAGAPPRPPLSQAGWLDAPFPVARRRVAGGPALDAQLDVEAGRLVVRGEEMGPVHGHLVVADGRASLAGVHATLWGGELSGDAAVRWGGPSAGAAARVRLAGADMARFFESREAKGGLDAEIQLSGRGATPRAWLASARGETRARIGRVRFESQPLSVLGKDVFQLLYEGMTAQEGAELHCMVVRSEVEGGLGRVGVVLDTPTTTLAGGGAVDLRALRADVVLRARSKGVSVAPLRAPIRIEGSLDGLHAGLDPAALAKEGAKILGLSLVNPLLVTVPLIDLGTGEENPCEKALERLGVEPEPQRPLLEASQRLLEEASRPLREGVGATSPDEEP